jgi:hypothetical protein
MGLHVDVVLNAQQQRVHVLSTQYCCSCGPKDNEPRLFHFFDRAWNGPIDRANLAEADQATFQRV